MDNRWSDHHNQMDCLGSPTCKPANYHVLNHPNVTSQTIPMSSLKPSQLKKKMPSTLIKNSSPDLLALTATSIGGMYSTGPNIIQRSPGERWYFSERINITNQHSTVIIWGFLENIQWTTSRWFERGYHHHDLKRVIIIIIIIIVISPLPIKWCTGHWLASFL